MIKGAQYDGAQLKEEKSFFIARAAIRPDEKKRHVWELLMGQPSKTEDEWVMKTRRSIFGRRQ
jgi:hypothetical protein